MIAGVAGSLSISGIAVLFGTLLFVAALRTDATAHAHLFPRGVANIWGEAGRGYAALFAFCAAAVGFGVYGAAILQTLYGLSPLFAGYVVGAEAMGWTVAALIVGEFSQSRDKVCIRAGATLILLGVASLAYTFDSGSLLLVIVSAVALGLRHARGAGAFTGIRTRGGIVGDTGGADDRQRDRIGVRGHACQCVGLGRRDQCG
jgi:hypothetical protein